MQPVLDYQGYCPICDKRVRFVSYGTWYRDNLICTECRSIPRFRAFYHMLKVLFPNYRLLKIHESSPTPTIAQVWDGCSGYSASYFYPDIPRGTIYNGYQCQDLEQLTFEDESFDVFVTMDVMEHIVDPVRAFKEISRVLKPGGIHIFTVPICWITESAPRVKRKVNGGLEYLKDPVYHENPIDKDGSLVTIDYGNDIGEFIFEASKMITTIYSIQNKDFGILGEMAEVLASRKQRL